MSMDWETSRCGLADIVERLVAGADNAPAISAPERPTLTHGGLREHMRATAATLNGLGLGRNDRIAIILPNGPEMASAFVSIAACATTAPLNPAYRAEELEFYLSDIGAKAIVVGRDDAGPAVAVAEKLGIAILRLSFDAVNRRASSPSTGHPLAPQR